MNQTYLIVLYKKITFFLICLGAKEYYKNIKLNIWFNFFKTYTILNFIVKKNNKFLLFSILLTIYVCKIILIRLALVTLKKLILFSLEDKTKLFLIELLTYLNT